MGCLFNPKTKSPGVRGAAATIESKIIIHMADNHGAGGVTGYMKYTAKFYNESATGKIDIYDFSAKDDK